jgi:hypothetical protein
MRGMMYGFFSLLLLSAKGPGATDTAIADVPMAQPRT